MADIDKVYLIDATSICYRSFYAIKLSTSKGFSTGAIYGFVNTLNKIRSKFSPNYIGVCFDVSRKTFRQEKFKEYKINRPAVPDNLKLQLPIIKKLVLSFGLSLLEKEGFEADDIIACIAKKAKESNIPVLIVSSDKDIYQLLEDDKIMVYNPVIDKIFTEKDFLKEFGFSPKFMVDYLALVGDNVDNIPGAKGIGKITASKLISEFQTIENIFNNLDKLSLKLKDLLIREKENIFLSKELAKLNADNLDISLKDLKTKEQNYKEIFSIFNELEFKSLIKNIELPSFDLNIEVREEKIIFDESSFYIFWSNKDFSYIFLSDKNVCKVKNSDILHFFKNKKIRKISYDFKSLMHILNTEIEGIYFDVMIAGYLVSPSLASYSLPNLCSYYLNEFINDIPDHSACYLIEKLYKVLKDKLKEKDLESLFFNIEMPLISILYRMERNGINIDMEKISNLLKEVDFNLKNIEKSIFKISNKEFNINSSQQLQKILFGDLKIKPIQKTKTGFSTSEEVLEKLAKEYEIAKLILEYRQLNKLKNTYILPIIEMAKLNNSKIYTNFSQTATETGRLSSYSLNLQSIPTKGKFSSLLRSAFISSFPDGYIVSFDYSQIELRILAHLSGDENLKSAFLNDLDIHSYTASILFSKDKDLVTEEERSIAKTVNFGIIYGMSAYGLSKQLDIPYQEAESFINEYFLRYPKVESYIQKVYQEAQEKGYVTTIFKRRRELPDIRSSNQQLKELAKRQAINAPIQGLAADLIKIAMIRIDNEFKNRNINAKFLLQIHDELIFDVPKDELDIVIEVVRENMQNALKLDVPIKVNVKYAKTWIN